jgi:hypothetical protein
MIQHMTIKISKERGTYKSITGADVGDTIMFMSNNIKNTYLPRGVKLNHPYVIVSVDELGWTRFMKTEKKTCISGCEPNQVGRYTILHRLH